MGNNTRLAIKIGLLAGLVSALYPSLPTIVSFGYWQHRWFQLYVAISLLILIAIYVMV